MGKGIVYCQDCGKSLREEMFERGKAHMLDDRPYCIACRRPDITPPTGTIPKVAPPGQTPRHGSPVAPAAPEKPSAQRLPLIMGGALAGVAFIVLLVVLLSGGKEAPPGEPPDAPAAAGDPGKDAVEAVRAFAASSEDPDAILARCRDARAKTRGTPWDAKLAEVAKAAEAQKAARARQEGERFEAFLKQIRTKADEDRDFSRRLEIDGMIAAALKIAGARSSEVEILRADLKHRFEQAAEKRVAEVKAAVARLQGEEKYAEAAAAIGELPASLLATEKGALLAALKPGLERKAEEAEKTARVWIEGEDMKVLEKTGTVQQQDMKKLGSFSNGIQLWWRECKVGDVLRLEFPSNVTGHRRVILALTMAPDYGIVRLSVNGTVVAESVDLYNAKKVISSGELPFEVDVKKGPNELKVEITGTNPAAKPANYMFGIDYLRIE